MGLVIDWNFKQYDLDFQHRSLFQKQLELNHSVPRYVTLPW